jgi:hypothetical protein
LAELALVAKSPAVLGVTHMSSKAAVAVSGRSNNSGSNFSSARMDKNVSVNIESS